MFNVFFRFIIHCDRLFFLSFTLLFVIFCRVVVPFELALRPKILGISKLNFHKTNEKIGQQEEKELRLERGSYVKIIAGRWSNAYGQVEGFDQDTGRIMVKMALNNNIISVNEDLVQLVTKADYLKNSKVLSK